MMNVRVVGWQGVEDHDKVDRTCGDEGGLIAAETICSAWPHPSAKSLYADNSDAMH